ncbi:MAG TPA: hypothetical protein VHT75_02100 [Acidimicrobiales bacterium]|nr:hypothetical protein [Acidimicrobiales bacterium]
MSGAELLLAILCGGVFVGCGLVVALAIRQAYFASWRGSQGVVVVAMVWICWALTLGQLLGAVGLLRRGALLLGAMITAGASLLLRTEAVAGEAGGGKAAGAGGAGEATGPSSWLLLYASAVLVLLVAAIWVARTVIVVHRGINDPDSLGYHLPFAATFAQTGYANQHLYVLPTFPVHFYPANDELLQSIALALTHSFAFTTVKNLLFGGLVLVAAHALGKAYGAGVLAVAGAALVLGLPVIAFTQPGEGVNDTLLVLLIVGGVALLAHARDRPAPYVLALACAGAAAGVKFSGVAPAAALAVLALVLLVVRLPEHRVRVAVAGFVAAGLAGGSWYLRNVITYGNPVPPSRIGLGPIHLRQIPTELGARSSTALGFLVRGRYYGQFHRGLERGLGPLFLVVLAFCVVGIGAGLVQRDGFRRGLAAFALVAAIGYLATPASAFGLDGARHDPSGFVINLHYAAVALVAGVIACGIVLAGWRLAPLFPLLGVAVVATGIVPGQRLAFWTPEIGGRAFDWLVAAAVVGATALALARWPAVRRLTLVTGLAAVVIGLVGVGLVDRRYPSLTATDPVVQWAARHTGARIVGYAPDVGLLYGPGAHNRVITLTRTLGDAPVEVNSCPAWKEAVIAGRYQWSAAIPGTVWGRWLSQDPAFKPVARDAVVLVFEVVGVPDVACPGQS